MSTRPANNRITRKTTYQTVVVDTATIGNCTEIDYREFAGGGVVIPTSSAITVLNWYGRTEADSTYYALYDDVGAALAQAVTSAKGYPIPDACFGWAYLKIISTGGDGESIYVSLKG